jgi:hypothetical protein
MFAALCSVHMPPQVIPFPLLLRDIRRSTLIYSSAGSGPVTKQTRSRKSAFVRVNQSINRPVNQIKSFSLAK